MEATRDFDNKSVRGSEYENEEEQIKASIKEQETILKATYRRLEKIKENRLKYNLEQEGRSEYFHIENAFRKAKENEKKEEANLISIQWSREAGCWTQHKQVWEVSTKNRFIPPQINKSQIDWIQKWLTTWGDKLSKTKTVYEIWKLFCDTFMNWLFLGECEESSPHFYHWYNKNIGEDLEGKTNEEKYEIVQKWLIYAKDYMEKDNCIWYDHLDEGMFKYAQFITFDSCLYAMTKEGGVFENGIIEIENEYIKWVTPVYPYISLRFE